MEYKKMSDYPYHFGLKTRIYPNNRQKRIIHINSEASRIMYNQIVAINNEIFELEKMVKPFKYVKLRQKQPYTASVINNDPNTHYIYQTTCALGNFAPYLNRLQYLYTFKNKVPHIAKVHTIFQDKAYDSLAGSYAYKAYQRAWRNYQNGLQNRPCFHSKAHNPYVDKYQTYVNPRIQTVFVDQNHLKLPKLKQLRCDPIRNLIWDKTDWASGTIAISKDASDCYWVSIQLGSQTPFVKAKPKTNRKLGVDLNLDNFATDSEGQVIANPRYFIRQQEHLARMKRILEKKVQHASDTGQSLRDNKDYQQLRRKIARVNKKVYNQRESFLQKLTTDLVTKNDIIVAENLKSHNMLKNHHLAKAIQDVGWRKFLTIVEYKCRIYHKQFVTVNPRLTTQTCSNCGYVLDKQKHERLTLSDRQWTCPSCHFHHIRDVNAAKNILAKGLDHLKTK